MARRAELYLKENSGIEIGVRVPGAWRQNVQSAWPSAVSVCEDFATGRAEVALATISYREFDVYWSSFTSSISSDVGTQTMARIGEERGRFRWQVENDNPAPELGSAWLPIRIHHRYFDVWHKEI